MTHIFFGEGGEKKKKEKAQISIRSDHPQLFPSSSFKGQRKPIGCIFKTCPSFMERGNKKPASPRRQSPGGAAGVQQH